MEINRYLARCCSNHLEAHRLPSADSMEQLCLICEEPSMHLHRLHGLMEHEHDAESRKPVRAQCMKIIRYLAQCCSNHLETHRLPSDNSIEWLYWMHLQALIHLHRLHGLMKREHDEESRKPVRAKCMRIGRYLARCLLEPP
jgi:hypothetical protein